MSVRILVATLTTLLFSACGVDISPGSQFAGQTCFSDGDCREGLICVSRICTPTGSGGGGTTDAGNNGNNAVTDGGNVNNANNVLPDGGILPDQGEACELGDVRCVDDQRRAECIETESGPRFVSFACPADTACDEGRCVGDFPCMDQDGDGYGDGCPAGPDCEDRVASINPGVEESCATPFDDNCNGEAQEGCPVGGCCPNGCADSEFCNAQCQCQTFDPEVCQFQNQPCTNPDQFTNNLFCAEIGDGFRCVGICDQRAPDPAATCPEPNSVCAFGDDVSGVCLSGCDPDIGCGEPGLGCLPVSGSALGGMCIPSNMNPLGSSCSADIFFDCAPGLLCVDFEGNGQGQCEEACRPFGTDTTDCRAGNFCLPFSAEIGLCVPDSGANEGDTCMGEGLTCGDDAVGCYPAGFGGTRCQRLCRLQEGDVDCPTGRCRQFAMDQNVLGVCRGGN
jgi:hypothetical protein